MHCNHYIITSHYITLYGITFHSMLCYVMLCYQGEKLSTSAEAFFVKKSSEFFMTPRPKNNLVTGIAVRTGPFIKPGVCCKRGIRHTPVGWGLKGPPFVGSILDPTVFFEFRAKHGEKPHFRRNPHFTRVAGGGQDPPTQQTGGIIWEGLALHDKMIAEMYSILPFFWEPCLPPFPRWHRQCFNEENLQQMMKCNKNDDKE